jgi:pimeloyl-ACP methyl ester carboxylesterase
MNARTDFSVIAAAELYFATMPSGLRVPYQATGSGEPLLFIHGSLCDYRYWNGQASALSKDYLCISVSLSHYWPSDDSASHREFSWQAHVGELAEFIAAMNLGPVHVVGHSRGGCVAYQLARRHPELVKTLVLADPGGPLDIDGKLDAVLPEATRLLRADVAALIEGGAIDAGLEMFVDSVSMPGTWRRSPANFRTMAIANAATLPKQFADPMPAYRRAEAAGVRCRTLLVEGEKSPRMYRDNVASLAQWIGQADRRTIAGASHGMSVTHPGAFNRVLLEFLRAAAA